MKISRTSLFTFFMGCALLFAGTSCSSKKDVTADASAAPATDARTTAGAGEASTDSSNEFSTVYFDYDSFKLRADAKKALKRNVEYMTKNPNVAIQLEGHCDERGSVEYNLALGEKRANAARHFLAKHGIAESRLSIISYGKERPADPGHDETAWAKNRRDTFNIVTKNLASDTQATPPAKQR